MPQRSGRDGCVPRARYSHPTLNQHARGSKAAMLMEDVQKACCFVARFLKGALIDPYHGRVDVCLCSKLHGSPLAE